MMGVSAKQSSDNLCILTVGEKINLPLLWVNSGERLPEMSSWSTRVLRLSTVVWDDIVAESRIFSRIPKVDRK